MKNSKSSKKIFIIIGICAVLVLLIIGGIVVSSLIAKNKREAMINEQNYAAAKLLELGDYDGGRTLAMKSEEMSPGAVSKQIIALAAGFQADFATASSVSDKWLSEKELADDEVLTGVRDISLVKLSALDSDSTSGGYSSYVSEKNTELTLDDASREIFMRLLTKVLDSIQLKKDIASLQAIIEAYSTGSESALRQLEEDDSLISKSVRARTAVAKGDYETAFELHKSINSTDSSFTNRSALANLVASGEIDIGFTPDEKKLSELSELYEKSQSIDDKISDMYSDGSSADALVLKQLNDEIEQLDYEITTLKTQIYSEPARRAINYIETTTPLAERSDGACLFELAYLYHRVGDDQKAGDLLLDLWEKDGDDAFSLIVSEMSDVVNALPNGSRRQEKFDAAYERASEILGFVAPSHTSEDFPEFLSEFLDGYFNGVILRDIDSSDFPTVRVTINIPQISDKKLKKSDLALSDMDAAIKNFRVTDRGSSKADEIETNIMLVVDQSGSMSGSPLESTKKAVLDFSSGMRRSTKLGLAVFNNYGKVISAPTTSRTELVLGIDSIFADGGTNICDGLRVSGNTLAGLEGRKIIILLSDGEDGNPSAIDDVLDELNLMNVTVYTIGFGGADATYLEYIASKCGGKYLQADSEAVLSEIYGTIGETFENDYTIEFEAAAELDKLDRHLSVASDRMRFRVGGEYHVGPTSGDITDERESDRRYGCFRQYGGSNK